MARIPTLSVTKAEMTAPFVVALDVGSTASRGGLYDSTGRPVHGSKQRVAHTFTTRSGGVSTIDADQVVRECATILDGIAGFAAEAGLESSLRGVCLDTFASSLVLVDAHGQAITPCITYADSRSRDAVARLRRELDESAYHARTGVRLHTSYLPARLAWLADTSPDRIRSTAAVMSLGEYVWHRLAGVRGLARSTAAWAGILDAHTGELDTPILSHVGADPSWFAPLVDPDEPLTPAADSTAAAQWPALSRLPWFAAIPDGWASNVGPAATGPDTVAVAAATSGAMRVILPEVPADIPAGLWCYRLSRSSCIVGGALNDVGRAITWLEDTVRPVESGDLAAALTGDPLDDVPTVLPFFSGERSTGWAADARAAFVGITSGTGPLELWRGVVEGLATSYSRIWGELVEAGARPRRVVASGRATSEHPEWLQPLADALGTPVAPLEMKRATLRGTALIALEALGVARPSKLPFGRPYEPAGADRADYYRALRERFDACYPVTSKS